MVHNNFDITFLLFALASLLVIASSELCDEFFESKHKFPAIKGQAKNGVVKLCQNHLTGSKDGKPLYATLFDTNSKIPIYSANAVKIDPNAKTYDRPNNKKWKRVSSALCVTTLPAAAVFYSRITAKGNLANCDKFQALDADYNKNTKDLTRGHLCPNSINKRDEEKQLGTFTLTNAAPQYTGSNQQDWRKIECVAEKAIEALVPNEKVYIITGVSGEYPADKALNNRVKTPLKFWKLVCYPGPTDKKNKKKAWAFGIVRDNKPSQPVTAKTAYVTLKTVADLYFSASAMPFTDTCLNAPMGDFKTLLDSKWDTKAGSTSDCK